MAEREERQPSNRSHVGSTFAQIFAEPFMNVSRYLASHELGPTRGDHGVETWDGPMVQATQVKIGPPETLADKQAKAQEQLKLKPKKPEA